MAALAGVIGEVKAGRSRVVLLEGPGGIGKTRLLDEARRSSAQRGVVVLSARAGELERECAFGVVRQLFEPAVALSGGTLLDGAAGAARGVFELVDGVEPREQTPHPSFASLHGLYWLTVNVSAEAPLVLAIDDLQWCDEASARFLAYLVRRLEGLSVLVVGTLRTVDWGECAPLEEITRDPLAVSIHPAALSETAAHQLVIARLGGPAEPAFSAACHAVTGGNPLLLHELLKTLDDEGVSPTAAQVATVASLGPATTSRAMLLRLARLPAGAARIARAAAVLGEDSDLSTVAALADTGIEEAGEAVAALVGAEVLRAGSPLGFVHPLIGAAVRNEMTAAQRSLAHERAARVLADRGGARSRVAAHLLASPSRGAHWVVETLMQAASSALRQGAAASAVAYLTRALREPPPPSQRAALLLELGRAEALTDGPAAVEHLTLAYEQLHDVQARAAAAQILGRVLLFCGQPAEGATLARRAVAELPRQLDDLRRALQALELMALLLEGDNADARRRLARHRTRPLKPGVGAKMLAALAAEEWMRSGGPAGDCAELALAALTGGELIAADAGLLGVTAIVVLALADREEAVEAWDASLADAHRRGSLFAKKSVTLWRGFTLYRRGELADAEASVHDSAEGQLWGIGAKGRHYHDAILSAVLRERGQLDAARSVLERSTDAGDEAEATRHWLYSKLELLVAESRFEEALAVAGTFKRRFAQVTNPVDTPWRTPAAVALAHLGRGPEARTLAQRELELARRWGAPGTVARALRTLGAIEGDAGIDHLRQAAAVAAGSPARLEHAKALAALGAALRRARRPAEARDPLRRSLELADGLGAHSLARDVRSELFAAGGRPRRSALAGVAALTAGERRVAALAAAGHTNRQIGQTLFVTPKTVELHLSNAYRKLGIRSRHQLPADLQTVPSA